MKKAYKIASVMFSFILIAVSVALYMAYQNYLVFLSTPLAVDTVPYKFSVPRGSGYQDVVRQLKSEGLLEHSRYLDWYVRQESLAHRLKAGHYSFASAPTPVEFFDRLVNGKVEQHRLTIIEGWTFRQMLKAIQQHPHVKSLLVGLRDDEIMQKLGYEGEHPEGRFLPDTYLFPEGETDIAFLKRAYKKMHMYLHEAWDMRNQDIELNSAYEALIMASIVEKETGAAFERAEISGVFNRRLKKGMRLQTDPTVIYGMGEAFDGNIRRKDLRTDTPYNTYTRSGLPPTPIALPGKAAIDAALHPKSGNSLYFVSKGDGTHYFSATLDEHNNAVRKYQLRRKK